MNVLITGANGQLGKELCHSGEYFASTTHPNLSIHGLSRTEFDVTNRTQISNVLESLRPDCIIHAAAFTNVDLAEAKPIDAYAVNTYGTRNLVLEADRIAAHIAYISSDYVFSGTKMSPYHEWDIPSPLNVYGNTKLAGESIVQTSGLRHYIFRTSWLYGEYGSNFVKSMIRLATEKKRQCENGKARLSVVTDQTGSPTNARDLAHGIWNHLLNAPDAFGTFHLSGTGSCSWFEFAAAIFTHMGWLDRVDLQPTTTAQLARPALRPSFSALTSIALPVHGLPALRHWTEALTAFLQEPGALGL